MRIAVNGWRLLGSATGVARYTLNILRHWTDDALPPGVDGITLYTPKALGDDADLPASIGCRVLGPEARLLVWENLRLGPAAREDVLFCPSYSRPLVTRPRTVVTTHDATSKLHPELFPRSVRWLYNPLYGWSARHAALVITDSGAARDDIASVWDVDPGRIRVVHMAAADVFHPVKDRDAVAAVHRRRVGSDAPYFLFVGKLSGRRSLPLLLRSFAELRRREDPPHKLVVVGLNIHNLDVSRQIDELGLTDHVCYPGFLPDEELNLLVNGAVALISPSVYETVSLPVMEAQRAGTPVVCLDTPGMREITGGEALLIERPEVDELAAALARLASDETLRAGLSERGLTNARRFSWGRCARETLQVCLEAAGGGS